MWADPAPLTPNRYRRTDEPAGPFRHPGLPQNGIGSKVTTVADHPVGLADVLDPEQIRFAHGRLLSPLWRTRLRQSPEKTFTHDGGEARVEILPASPPGGFDHLPIMRIANRSSSLRDVRGSGASRSPDILGENVVDERLVAQAAPLRFSSDRREDLGIDPNGNQSPGFRAQRRPPDTSHSPELNRGQLWDIGEINLVIPPYTPTAPSGSRGAR